MNSHTCTAVLAGLAGCVALAVPAAAAAADALSATDARGDVRIYAHRDGLSKPLRRSIDIRTLQVGAGEGRKVRFTVGIKDIVRRPKFDQMFFVTLKPPPASGEEWHGDIGFTSKGRDSYAYLYDDSVSGGGTWCEIGDGVRLNHAEETVSLDVPRRCVPAGRAKVHLDSYTGLFRTDAAPWSRDRLRAPGSHDLTP